MPNRLLLLSALAVLVALLTNYFDRGNNQKMAAEGRVVLPTNVKPSHYIISLKPDLVGFTFTGEESVKITVNQTTKSISLNAVELRLSDARVVQGERTIVASNITHNEETEVAVIELPEELALGEAVVSFKFEGSLNDKMKGFYRSGYTYKGEQRYMAVTQFEPTDARRAFPCWDEPALKATFEVSLVVPEDRTAISNMPEVSIVNHPEEKLKTVKFGVSPIMSTYLVAFAVADLESIETTSADGVQVRVFTQPGRTEQGKFALDVAARVLPFYKEYFGIPYPLPKLDQIAVPDFAAGAMENWGLVTYRETALLVDPLQSSASSRQWVALVVAHELAHQWFGNLVTMEWWTDLWLNEGFATWVEYLAVDHLFPEWNIWNQFVFMDVNRALQLDALESSHPIEVDVKHPAEIEEIFDIISYSKGSSVIRQLQAFLGSESFRNGLKLYLGRHVYSNAITTDLWAALSEASGQPVSELMHSWTRQTGYPVVTLQESKEDPNVLTATQSRFFAAPNSHSDKTLWYVPLGYVSSKDPKTPVSTLFKDTTTTVAIPADADWIKFNPEQSMFFRTLYPAKLWEKLVPAIRSGALSPLDRLGVENDAVALSRAGLLSTRVALEILNSYSQETEYTVWADVNANIGEIAGLLAGEADVFPQFKLFVRKLFADAGARLGWDAKEGDDHSTALLRPIVLGRLGLYGDDATIAEAKSRHAKFASDRTGLVPDLRQVTYNIALRHGGVEEHEQLINVLRTSELHEEKIRCLKALGQSSDPALLARTLEFSMTSEVKSQDLVFVVESIAMNPHGTQIAWDWTQRNWDFLNERYGRGGFFLSRLVKSFSGFSSDAKATEIEEFFKTHSAPAATMAIKQCVEAIRSNAAWLSRDKAAIKAWLDEHFPL